MSKIEYNKKKKKKNTHNHRTFHGEKKIITEKLKKNGKELKKKHTQSNEAILEFKNIFFNAFFFFKKKNIDISDR